MELKEKGNSIGFYCHKDQVIVGQIKEDKEDSSVNQEVIERIINNAQKLKVEYETPFSKL